MNRPDSLPHHSTGKPKRRAWTVEQVQALGVRTDLVTAASILGIGRTTAHELARRGEFPVPLLRVGRRYVVPTAPILRLLGVDPDPDADHRLRCW